MNLPAPLPVEQEHLVVVEIVDGIADTTLVHLPATQLGHGGFRFDSYDFPPTTWPPACGRIRSGSVYAHAGMLEGVRVCLACEEAA